MAEQLPVFETSALFILLHAYEKFSGNVSWARKYLPILKGYADYLAANTLYHDAQLTSVDAISPSANQTGLAVQGAIGLRAASVVTGDPSYGELGSAYAWTLFNGALGLDGVTVEDSTHFTYNYGNSTTWNVLFPAFSDALLELETFPPEAWEMQSLWYEKQMQPDGLPYAGPVQDVNYTGKPLTWGLTDWSEYPFFFFFFFFFFVWAFLTLLL